MIADDDDPAAKLWRDYLRTFDRLEALTDDPDAATDRREVGDLIDRARCLMADLSFAKPTTPLGAVASLYAAKHFAAEAQDTTNAQARDSLYRAVERCVEAALSVFEPRAPEARAQMESLSR